MTSQKGTYGTFKRKIVPLFRTKGFQNLRHCSMQAGHPELFDVASRCKSACTMLLVSYAPTLKTALKRVYMITADPLRNDFCNRYVFPFKDYFTFGMRPIMTTYPEAVVDQSTIF